MIVSPHTFRKHTHHTAFIMFLHPPRLATLAGLANLGTSVAQTGQPRPPFSANDVWLTPLLKEGVCEVDYKSPEAVPVSTEMCLMAPIWDSFHVADLPRCPNGRSAWLTLYREKNCRDVLRVYNGPGEAPWSTPGCVMEAPGSFHSLGMVCPVDGDEVKGDEFKWFWDFVFPDDGVDEAPTRTSTSMQMVPTAVATSPSELGESTTAQDKTTKGPLAGGASSTDTATAGLDGQMTTTLEGGAGLGTATSIPKASAGQCLIVPDWFLRTTSAIVAGVALMAS